VVRRGPSRERANGGGGEGRGGGGGGGRGWRDVGGREAAEVRRWRTATRVRRWAAGRVGREGEGGNRNVGREGSLVGGKCSGGRGG